MAEKDEYRTGAFELGDGMTPVDIWHGLHTSEPLWVASIGVNGGAENQKRIDTSDLSQLEKLQCFPAKRWAQMCDGIGWTPLGAVALSWCQGATKAIVQVGWSVAIKGVEQEDSTKRAKRLVNQDIP